MAILLGLSEEKKEEFEQIGFKVLFLMLRGQLGILHRIAPVIPYGPMTACDCGWPRGKTVSQAQVDYPGVDQEMLDLCCGNTCCR